MTSKATTLAFLLLCAACLPVGAQVPASLHACASIPSDRERLACFDREDARLSDNSSSSAAQASSPSRGPAAAALGAAPGLAASQEASGSPVSTPRGQATPGSPAATAAPANPLVPAGNATAAATATVPSSAPPAAPLPPEQTFGLTGDQLLKLQTRQQGSAPPKKLKNLSAQVASASQNSSGLWVMTLDNGQIWRQTQDQRDFDVSPGETVKISTGAMGSFWLQTNRHNWAKVERVQ